MRTLLLVVCLAFGLGTVAGCSDPSAKPTGPGQSSAAQPKQNPPGPGGKNGPGNGRIPALPKK